ncbi:hypothetical protein T492DRAFT_1141699 [Pavlovales sp. CCMP2436]|nr:hypothetical protein T492DRAFT_1141699 [Pavlovales sp. CCMP2436]
MLTVAGVAIGTVVYEKRVAVRQLEVIGGLRGADGVALEDEEQRAASQMLLLAEAVKDLAQAAACLELELEVALRVLEAYRLAEEVDSELAESARLLAAAIVTLNRRPSVAASRIATLNPRPSVAAKFVSQPPPTPTTHTQAHTQAHTHTAERKKKKAVYSADGDCASYLLIRII